MTMHPLLQRPNAE